MTTLIDTTPTTAARPAQPLGLRIRRHALVALPVLAGVCLTVGAAADPAAGISGNRMFKLYAEHPDALQIKSLAFHWAYAFWIGTAFIVTGMVRGRGVWLANAAGAIAFAGMTTLPGLLFADWVDSATGQLWGVDGVNAMHDRVEAISWGFPYFQLPGLAGMVLALPLAALALWRAGIVRWWAPAAVVGAFVAFAVSAVTWPGCLVATLCFAVFSVALARDTQAGRSSASMIR
jgi:hypothetical protein